MSRPPITANEIPFGGDTKRTIYEPQITTVGDVEPQPVTWIWPGRIAVGKLTIVSGDPGLGKSFATLDWTARISSGRPWPDGAAAQAPGHVLLLSAEDAIGDTIRPRLDAAGADVARVHCLTGVVTGDRERSVTLADIEVVEAAITATSSAVVIVDPLTAYLAGTDSHRDADVRGLLAPLAALADRRRVAVVAVMHLNKLQGQRAIYRAGGSIAFTAAARIVLAVAADPEQGGRRILAPVKSNLAVPPPALAFCVAEGRVEWEDGPVAGVDVDALLNPAPAAQTEDRTAAETLIAELLADTDRWPLEARTALDAGRQHGIPERTLRWTAKRAGIRIERMGFGASGRWFWHRPIAATPLHTSSVAPMTSVAPMVNGVGFQHVAEDVEAHSGHIGNTGNREGDGDADDLLV